jgi:hypothetical protein
MASNMLVTMVEEVTIAKKQCTPAAPARECMFLHHRRHHQDHPHHPHLHRWLLKEPVQKPRRHSSAPWLE